jgi:hypothetical protein
MTEESGLDSWQRKRFSLLHSIQISFGVQTTFYLRSSSGCSPEGRVAKD